MRPPRQNPLRSAGSPAGPADDPPAVDERLTAFLADATSRPPSQLLRELVEADPLGLLDRVRDRLRERWSLLDPERVFQRAAARVTYFASLGEAPGAERADLGEPLPPEVWLGLRVDEAIGDCLSIDERGAREDARAGGCDAAADHRLFAEAFGAGEALARRASVHFHRCPDRARRILIETLMDAIPIDDCVAAGLGPVERLRNDLLRVLDAASGAEARREDAARAAGAPSPEEVSS